MDVSKLPQMKSAIVFDITAMSPGSSALRFVNYLMALNHFMRKGQVLQSFIIISDEIPQECFCFKI